MPACYNQLHTTTCKTRSVRSRTGLSVGEARASGPWGDVLESVQQISGVGEERPQLGFGIATLRLGAQATV